MFLLSLLVSAPLLPSVLAQLNASTGPLTTPDTKRCVKVCDVTDYGAVADGTTDLGPPLYAAFNACATGGVVDIPAGTYTMSTFVTLSGGEGWALNLEGTIERAGNVSTGNMIAIDSSRDFEFYSANGKGAIQGYGYRFLSRGKGVYGPRILRLTNVTNFAVHDIALVDSPAFHLVLAACTHGEVYNMIIRGANEGGLDGIDVWGSNIWVHDVEVTNKDECVTVKSPADHILVENIYCNWSGGCAMGSLNAGTEISHIEYNNVYTVNSNQMQVAPHTSRTVDNVTLTNFIGHSNAYSLYINAAWASEAVQPGPGILYSNITFGNWTGDCADGASRAPLRVICPASVPCEDIVIEDFAIWTDVGDEEEYVCANARGSGGCLVPDAVELVPNRTTTETVTAAPEGWQAAYMPDDLSSGLGVTTSIAIPTVPTTFFPSVTPATARAYAP